MRYFFSSCAFQVIHGEVFAKQAQCGKYMLLFLDFPTGKWMERVRSGYKARVWGNSPASTMVTILTAAGFQWVHGYGGCTSDL